jgi:simple sugar transport system ATP-binding protein
VNGRGVSLVLEGISKRFGTVQALVDASLHVRAGSVHALLGENGAGKTTLMRIAYGLIAPDSGEIRIDGRLVRLSSPRNAIRHGIGMVHQHFALVRAMTVAENVALGGRGRYDPRATALRVRELARSTGMTLDPATKTEGLGVTAQQQLEILKALARNARILILDEPTAALSPGDARHLLDQVRALATAGLAVVLITHKLREALSVADHVTVLRQGRTVLAASAAALDEETVTRQMLGGWNVTAEAERVPSKLPATTPPVVRVRRVDIRDDRGVLRVLNATFDVGPGEIVGIAGAEGAGVHELLRGLVGLFRVTGGEIERPIRVGFIPADRHREGVALGLSVAENIALRGAGTRRGLTHWESIREHTRQLVSEYDIRTPSIEAPVETLSGGNQQKLVLARELGDRPDLLVAENPTRGLDIRSAMAVRARLLSARETGVAIVLYSSDLDELADLADRTFAMFEGRLIATERTRDAIGQAMLGLAQMRPVT